MATDQIKQSKQNMRQEILLNRISMNADQKIKYDAQLCEALIKLIQERKATVVHCFIPMKNEINLIPFIKNLLLNRKTVVAPKALSGGILKHLVLSSLENVEKGIFGTVFPSGNNEYEGKYDVIVVPGLAFDKSGFRLGYGGGYYDRFLERHPGSLKVSPAYPFQLVDRVPVDAFDQKIDKIILPGN